MVVTNQSAGRAPAPRVHRPLYELNDEPANIGFRPRFSRLTLGLLGVVVVVLAVAFLAGGLPIDNRAQASSADSSEPPSQERSLLATLRELTGIGVSSERPSLPDVVLPETAPDGEPAEESSEDSSGAPSSSEQAIAMDSESADVRPVSLAPQSSAVAAAPISEPAAETTPEETSDAEQEAIPLIAFLDDVSAIGGSEHQAAPMTRDASATAVASVDDNDNTSQARSGQEDATPNKPGSADPVVAAAPPLQAPPPRSADSPPSRPAVTATAPAKDTDNVVAVSAERDGQSEKHSQQSQAAETRSVKSVDEVKEQKDNKSADSSRRGGRADDGSGKASNKPSDDDRGKTGDGGNKGSSKQKDDSRSNNDRSSSTTAGGDDDNDHGDRDRDKAASTIASKGKGDGKGSREHD